MFDFDHIVLGDSLGDSHDQGYLCVDRFKDGWGRKLGRHVNY